MTVAMSPEVAIAALRQERLTWLSKRVEADDKVRTLEAQIAGAEFVLQLQAEAAARDDAVQPDADRPTDTEA
ncbi:hypothetical protein D3C72_511280 [compost metagenome]